ncbi:MAG: sulfotransferase [Verrucomicrobia bacterium]|nr:sulfotransferase [Verrucomicrobiota bacterium]
MRDAIANWVRRYAKVAAHPYEGLPLTVVAGIGRSGTTALRHCLSAHPALHSTDCENNIIYDLLATARHNCTFPSRQATMRVVQPAYDRQFRLLLLNLLWPDPRRGADRPAGLLAATDLRPDRADYFVQLFPAGRIAYIVRNGISVVSSRMSHANFKHEPFERHCETWCAAHAMAQWGESQTAFQLVRQESLLDPGGATCEVDRLCQRLGLSPHPACLDVLQRETFHPTAFAKESAADQDDLAKRGERWRLWSAEQCQAFERICGEAMRYFGYPIPWGAS